MDRAEYGADERALHRLGPPKAPNPHGLSPLTLLVSARDEYLYARDECLYTRDEYR